MATSDGQSLRHDIVRWGRSLFERGLTAGSSGNISVRFAGGMLATPTNSCLGFLKVEDLSHLNAAGEPIDGAMPTKELPLHQAIYAARPSAQAVVHLHSTYATLMSCLEDVDPADAIPPITPYIVMRVGRVPVLHPYIRPGSADIVPIVMAAAPKHAAFLLANHGPVVAGLTLESAVFAAEELEEAARLLIIARGLPLRHLSAASVADLNATFQLK